MRTILILASLLWAGAAPAQDFPAGSFELRNAHTLREGLCLTGGSAGTGGVRMEACRGDAGQLWRALPAGGGRWLLTEARSEPLGACLGAAWRPAPAPAAMDACAPVAGQAWIAVPLGDGTFQIAAVGGPRHQGGTAPLAVGVAPKGGIVPVGLSRPARAPIIEPGRIAAGAPVALALAHAAYPLGALSRRCLDGNSPSGAALMGGASFLDACRDTAGQRWLVLGR